jgi:hypothetical protein
LLPSAPNRRLWHPLRQRQDLRFDARVEAIRIHMVSIVVSIQAIFQPFPPSRPPDKPRGLSMYSAILPDLRPKR